MLSTRARVLLGVAGLLLATLYVLPIWRVSLAAPQYPEGLGMQIWLSTITGLKPNDLENINNLNHYIGMKRIVPDTIPELRYMPMIVGALIALAGAAALSGRRVMARMFVGAFIVVAIAGLVDFCRWEYDYGHDLDLENAIIKIPGMSYQPPLIGTRQLLNFTATSLPALGGILAFVSMACALLSLVIDRPRRPAPAMAKDARGRSSITAVAA